MGQQTVIAHTDTKTAGHPVKDNSGDYGGPTPEKKRCDGSDVCDNEENPGAPIPSAPIDVTPLARWRGFPILF
jgi:hypothetical protein